MKPPLDRIGWGRKGVDRQIVNIYPDTIDLPDSWYLPYRDEIESVPYELRSRITIFLLPNVF